jgi:amino acid permease
MARGDPEAYALAFGEGVRALSEQQAVIDSFRTRSGLLLSGAAIATSFLGQASLERGTSFVTWLAIGMFVVLGAAVIAILWPRGDWEYAIRPELVIANYIEHPEP